MTQELRDLRYFDHKTRETQESKQMGSQEKKENKVHEMDEQYSWWNVLSSERKSLLETKEGWGRHTFLDSKMTLGWDESKKDSLSQKSLSPSLLLLLRQDFISFLVSASTTFLSIQLHASLFRRWKCEECCMKIKEWTRCLKQQVKEENKKKRTRRKRWTDTTTGFLIQQEMRWRRSVVVFGWPSPPLLHSLPSSCLPSSCLSSLVFLPHIFLMFIPSFPDCSLMLLLLLFHLPQ